MTVVSEMTVVSATDGDTDDRGAGGISEGAPLVVVAAVGTRDDSSEGVPKENSEGIVDGTLDGLVVDRGACDISEGASLAVVAAVGTRDGTSEGILEEKSEGIVDGTLDGLVAVVVVGFGALTSRSSALRDDDLVFLDNAAPFEDFLVTLLLVVFLDTFFTIRWCWLMMLSILSILMIEEKRGAEFTVTIARKTIVKRKTDKMERFMMLKWKGKGKTVIFVELVVAIEDMILCC
jgi:hypothetical protein